MNLAELRVETVSRELEPRFNDLMNRHHQLGAGPKIGESIWYAGHFGHGDWVALAAFSAAALKCRARDDSYDPFRVKPPFSVSSRRFRLSS